MQDDLANRAVDYGDDEEIRQILREVCYITKMGFAAVALVTEARWIACQVEDRIGFGLRPGGELHVEETICDEIRQCGRAIIIDDVTADPQWAERPVPKQYGFESYASLPIILPDGRFFGTLCAIDPKPRILSAPTMVTVLEVFAGRVATILHRRMQG